MSSQLDGSPFRIDLAVSKKKLLTSGTYHVLFQTAGQFSHCVQHNQMTPFRHEDNRCKVRVLTYLFTLMMIGRRVDQKGKRLLGNNDNARLMPAAAPGPSWLPVLEAGSSNTFSFAHVHSELLLYALCWLFCLTSAIDSLSVLFSQSVTNSLGDVI